MIKRNVIALLLMCGLFFTACHHDTFQTIELTSDEMNALYSPAGTVPMGKANAPITLVEIFSYDCRYCRQDYPLIEQFVKTHPNVRVIFKPFMAFGPKTQVLAQYAALAAAKQGRFLAMHRALMMTHQRLNPRMIARMVSSLNLDRVQFYQDLNSAAVRQQIEENTRLMDRLGIDGIPTVIVTKTSMIDASSKRTGTISQYMQVGFLSNDILLKMVDQVKVNH